MSPRFTRYGFIAAVIATAASGLLYAVAKWRLNALEELGEGTVEEISNMASASNGSFLLLVVTSIVTMILLSFIIAQRR